MTDRPVIIVGVDNSATSEHALAWALTAAQRLGATVDAVTTYDETEGETARQQAQAVQASLVARAVAVLRDAPPVASKVMAGDPVDVLTLLSGSAYMLVMGRHSTAGLRHSAESSTAERVARLADCPVTIVPEQASRTSTTR